MSEFSKLLFGNDTPMDAAERAAIRRLIEMDLSKETEFDEEYSRENSIAGFPATSG